ncbi:MAG: ECF-type sigma factor, partial [Planctomycetota bacterium]
MAPIAGERDHATESGPTMGPDPGNVAAADLLPLVYSELRAVAEREVARERANHTLGATALV